MVFMVRSGHCPPAFPHAIVFSTDTKEEPRVEDLYGNYLIPYSIHLSKVIVTTVEPFHLRKNPEVQSLFDIVIHLMQNFCTTASTELTMRRGTLLTTPCPVASLAIG
jgi:hypothetical protein